MELVIIIVLSLIIAMGIYLWLLLHQIKQLAVQLKFLEKNTSRLRLTSELKNKNILELINLINNHIDNSNQLRIKLLQEEASTKKTITGLSHDIRTPLTSLDGYLQLMQSTDSPIKQAQFIEIMQERINSLTRILDELFTYAKLQGDAFELNLQEVNLNEFLAHTLFAFYEDFKQKHIKPKVKLSLENVIIMADANALERVIQNILKNSLLHGVGDIQIKLDFADREFTEGANSETVFLNHQASDSQRGIVILEFSNKLKPDTELNLNELFEEFYKADPTRQSSSTGLGLSIAKRLAEKMNARMNAEIIKSTFILRLYFPSISSNNELQL